MTTGAEKGPGGNGKVCTTIVKTSEMINRAFHVHSILEFNLPRIFGLNAKIPMVAAIITETAIVMAI
ncbi:unnamed protein product [marine sediment metagenome]|uniref:Uncharacterized protein n=1 Tax=marine sediment metagenome TaxID=412755 RepID=X1EH96_9ZZZZ